MTSCPEPVLANGDRFHEAHIYLTDGKETHTGVFKRKVSCWQVCPRDLEHVRKPARVHPGVNNCPCAKKNRPLSLCQPLPVDVWTRASLPWQMIDSKHIIINVYYYWFEYVSNKHMFIIIIIRNMIDSKHSLETRREVALRKRARALLSSHLPWATSSPASARTQQRSG
jgi:hypothetical protein